MNDQVALLVQQTLAANPALASLIGQSIQPVPPAPPALAAPVSPTPSFTDEEVLFLNLFKAFVATAEGNPIVGMLSKFARFAQSEVDKSKPKV